MRDTTTTDLVIWSCFLTHRNRNGGAIRFTTGASQIRAKKHPAASGPATAPLAATGTKSPTLIPKLSTTGILSSTFPSFRGCFPDNLTSETVFRQTLWGRSGVELLKNLK